MTDHFASEAEIESLVADFLALRLPKEKWTHAAHFATALWLIARHPDVSPERDMPDMIRRYNASVGGVNSDTAGYHETITQASLRAARAFMADGRNDSPLHEVVRALMASPLGHPDWLLAYWSKDRLMSVEARRDWVEPDLASFAP